MPWTLCYQFSRVWELAKSMHVLGHVKEHNALQLSNFVIWPSLTVIPRPRYKTLNIVNVCRRPFVLCHLNTSEELSISLL